MPQVAVKTKGLSLGELPLPGIPSWLRVQFPSGENYERTRRLLRRLNLHTVCEEARCPNRAECWEAGTATAIVLGDTCTRGCRFCSVKTLKNPPPPNLDEPKNLAEALSALHLEYIVVTSVCRDDLPDQGARHLALCIKEIKEKNPRLIVEFLIPDFRGDGEALRKVVEAQAHVLSHNLETVRRLTPFVRGQRSGYERSLKVLEEIKDIDSRIYTKSSLMFGFGELEGEVLEAMRDLRSVGVDILTLGQYLRPTGTPRNLPVCEYVTPEKFRYYQEIAEDLGFLYVASGPLVRSSYKAGEFFMKSVVQGSENSAYQFTNHIIRALENPKSLL